MDSFNTILQIPERCLLHKKITKAFFKRNFELTTNEKALLDDVNTIAAIDWLASISPTVANINRYQDEEYLFEEVQIISVQITETDFERNHFKIAELIQKYIPYPILLCIFTADKLVLNTCDKKINQNDHTKRIIEKRYTTEIINRNEPTEAQEVFFNSISFAPLDKTDLKTFYDSYTRGIIALQTAKLRGSFILRTQSRTQSDIDKLEKIETLQKEILLLQNQTKKETQLKVQIELNIEVQIKRKQIEHLKALITEQ